VSLLRSARFPAILLLAAAVVGLLLANSPLGPSAVALSHEHAGIPGTVL
jgi:Na+:H+ antiporter, NhaA family